MKGIYHILLMLILSGCSSSEDSFEPLFEVPDALLHYVDAFYQEAEQRGIDLDRDNLIIIYDDLSEENLCGSCNSLAATHQIQKIVTLVDPSQACWENKEQLEALIFHELGHCLLRRQHQNNLLPNGDPASLMIESSISQYSPCIYQIGNSQDCNFTFKREYYLDELFDPNTTVPVWAQD